MGEILAHVPMSALGPPDSAQQKAQASLGAWAWKREGQDEAQREEFLLLFVWFLVLFSAASIALVRWYIRRLIF